MTIIEDLASLYGQHVERLCAEYGRVLTECGYDGAVIHAGSAQKQHSADDQYWPFKPTPTFAHWLPLVEAGAVVVIENGAKPRLVRTAEADFWEGPAPLASNHFWDAFEVSQSPLGDIQVPANAVFIGDDLDAAAALAGETTSNPVNVARGLDAVRAVKSAYEVECIAEANRRGARGHAALESMFETGDHSELELHLAYLRATDQDATETPYGNIVALGENAAILHHVHYGRQTTGKLSLLVDAGATFCGYASDITRTHAKDDALFSALVSAIEAMQRTLCARLVVGLEYEDLHEQCHVLLADVLRELELSTASAEELVGSGATRTFLPHGLGHSLGLQVHDVGCRPREPRPLNPFLRTTSTIAAGNVFTVEPGCYFIAALLEKLRQAPISGSMSWPAIDSLRPYGGVRIEDNIAVLHDGTVNLTRDNWPH